ncbi:hypothetical protein CRENBAI_006842 [Crenichthys baileyi]|uniref:Uncharacterized protein n=1 Tax=Crenichthys baileyi TaxID=28760 RepID=A0AAV9S7L7_9TELE
MLPLGPRKTIYLEVSHRGAVLDPNRNLEVSGVRWGSTNGPSLQLEIGGGGKAGVLVASEPADDGVFDGGVNSFPSKISCSSSIVASVAPLFPWRRKGRCVQKERRVDCVLLIQNISLWSRVRTPVWFQGVDHRGYRDHYWDPLIGSAGAVVERCGPGSVAQLPGLAAAYDHLPYLFSCGKTWLQQLDGPPPASSCDYQKTAAVNFAEHTWCYSEL